MTLVSGKFADVDVESIPVTGGRWLVLRSVNTSAPLNSDLNITSAVLNSAEAIILVLDVEGRLVRFNRQAESLTGYSESEVVGKVFWELFVRPEDLASIQKGFQLLVAGQLTSTKENAWVMRDGSLRTIAWSNTAVRNQAGQTTHLVSTGIDVTHIRQTEIALASLSEQALKQMQGERQKLSRFLHDTVSQDLVALSFSLSRLQRDQRSPDALEALDRSLQLLDRCCRDIRLLSYILSPPLLSELGLVPALEWYGGQLQREAGMNVELSFDPLPEPPPPVELQSVLFATLQACVARSVRHLDKAKKKVSLRVGETMLTLEYQSFFEPDGTSYTNRVEFLEEFGVIRERLRQFGGLLEIEQRADSVRVIASVPTPQEKI